MASSFTLSEPNYNELVLASDDFYKQKFNTSTSSFARVGSNQHVCSFLKAQNRKQFTGSLKTTMTYTPEYTTLRTFMKQISGRPVTVFLKHHVCFFALVAQKLKREEGEQITLYELATSSTSQIVSQQNEIKYIINYIIDDRIKTNLVTTLGSLKTNTLPTFKNETDLLKYVFKDETSFNSFANMQALTIAINDIKIEPSSDDAILKFIKYHNPYQCTRLAFDVITMEQFSDLQFKDAYKFIHLGGYCFSTASLGPQIIIQKGQLRHGTVKIQLSEDDIEYMLNLLYHYSTLDAHRDEFIKDMKEVYDKYTFG